MKYSAAGGRAVVQHASAGVPPLKSAIRRQPIQEVTHLSGAPDRESRNDKDRLPQALGYFVVGVFTVLGATAAVAPDFVIASSRSMLSPAGIIGAAVLRTGVGIALLLVARRSRAPVILRSMAFLLLAVGVVLPFLGVENARSRVEWEAEHTMFLRIEGILFIWAGYVIHKLVQPHRH